MFFELFVLGSFWFWLLVIGALVLIELSVASENHWGFGVLVLFCAALWAFSSVNPLVWIWNNPWTLLVDSAIYLAIGLVWGISKWFFHLKNVKDSLQPQLTSLRSEYDKSKKEGQTFQQYLEYWQRIPVAKNNKNLISVWMIWWPFSLGYTLFADVIRRLCHWIMDHYIVVFNRINNAVFKDLN